MMGAIRMLSLEERRHRMAAELNRVELGAFLKKLRLRKGRSQIDIAVKVGVASINFISMLEHGKTSVPIDKFSRYMEAYGATYQESLLFFRSNWPDAWTAVCHLDNTCGALFREHRITEAYELCRHGATF
jgi:transcriptional regulator with XRE-family HTH domain